jgi:predicted DNA binding CopG/RHH family protein
VTRRLYTSPGRLPSALVIPSFSSERAETAWWDKNRAEVEAHLRHVLRDKAKAQPRVVMTPGYKKKFVPVAIGLTGADLDAARKIAEDRGIAYETYIKSLLTK